MKIALGRNALFVNLGIAAITMLLMFGACEFVVRFLYADTTVLFPRYHTDAQYGEFVIRRIHSNATFKHTSVDGSWQFVTNDKGFRNKNNFPYKKPKNIIRILSIGDSHTQGYEVRQDFTFSSIAEKYLIKNKYQVQVLNTGVSGFSNAEELIFLENEGIKYEPDVVLLGFFRNDIEDNIKTGLFTLDANRNLVVVKKQHIPGVRIQNFIYSIPGVTWLSENSYFYSILFNTTWSYFKKQLARSGAEKSAEYAISTQKKFSNYDIELTSKILQRIYEFCSVKGIKLIIIDIPSLNSEGEVISSVPSPLYPLMPIYSDAFIDSTNLLSKFSGVTETHVLHGHRHISEFTHAVIGVAAAEKIVALLGQKQNISGFSP